MTLFWIWLIFAVAIISFLWGRYFGFKHSQELTKQLYNYYGDEYERREK